MAAIINLPRILRVGAGASGQLVATLGELGLARPLLVTDPYMKTCGYCERLQVPLDEAGIAYGLFSTRVGFEPSALVSQIPRSPLGIPSPS